MYLPRYVASPVSPGKLHELTKASVVTCLVVDICVVADLKDLSQEVTNEMASQSSGVISN